MADVSQLHTVMHPVNSGGAFAIVSGENPKHIPEVAGGHKGLEQLLAQGGFKYEASTGDYGENLHSPVFIIHGLGRDQAMEIGRRMGQDSIVYSNNGQHEFVYVNGPHAGKYHPTGAQAMQVFPVRPDDGLVTSVPGLGHVRFNFDHGKLLDVPRKGNAMSEIKKNEVSVAELKKKLAETLKKKITELSKSMEGYAHREVNNNVDASVGDFVATGSELSLQSSDAEWMEELSKSGPRRRPGSPDPYAGTGGILDLSVDPMEAITRMTQRMGQKPVDAGNGWTVSTHPVFGTPQYRHQSGLSVIHSGSGVEALGPNDEDEATSHGNVAEAAAHYGLPPPTKLGKSEGCPLCGEAGACPCLLKDISYYPRLTKSHTLAIASAMQKIYNSYLRNVAQPQFPNDPNAAHEAALAAAKDWASRAKDPAAIYQTALGYNPDDPKETEAAVGHRGPEVMSPDSMGPTVKAELCKGCGKAHALGKGCMDKGELRVRARTDSEESASVSGSFSPSPSEESASPVDKQEIRPSDTKRKKDTAQNIRDIQRLGGTAEDVEREKQTSAALKAKWQTATKAEWMAELGKSDAWLGKEMYDETCPKCKGEGEKKGKKCVDCNGKGYHTRDTIDDMPDDRDSALEDPMQYEKGELLGKKTPPGFSEHKMRRMKEAMIEQYGEEKGTEVAYATAWKQHNKKSEYKFAPAPDTSVGRKAYESAVGALREQGVTHLTVKPKKKPESDPYGQYNYKLKSEDFIDPKNANAKPATTDEAKKGGKRVKNVGAETPDPAPATKPVKGNLDEGSGGDIEKGKKLGKQGLDPNPATSPAAAASKDVFTARAGATQSALPAPGKFSGAVAKPAAPPAPKVEPHSTVPPPQSGRSATSVRGTLIRAEMGGLAPGGGAENPAVPPLAQAEKKYFKPCRCGGAPDCQKCSGSGRVRDYRTEEEADARWEDERKDRNLEKGSSGPPTAKPPGGNPTPSKPPTSKPRLPKPPKVGGLGKAGLPMSLAGTRGRTGAAEAQASAIRSGHETAPRASVDPKAVPKPTGAYDPTAFQPAGPVVSGLEVADVGPKSGVFKPASTDVGPKSGTFTPKPTTSGSLPMAGLGKLKIKP